MKMLLAVFALILTANFSYAQTYFVAVANDSKGTPEIQSLRFKKVPIGKKNIPNRNINCGSFSEEIDCRDEQVTIYGMRPVLTVKYQSFFDAPTCDREVEFSCDNSSRRRNSTLDVTLKSSDLSSNELVQIKERMSTRENKELAQALFKAKISSKKSMVSYWGGCAYTNDNNRVDPHCREVRMKKEVMVKGISISRQ